ncbi:MAG: hypothetical protein COZ05_04690 [Armatimonadetes bacterium CG_4_10_14_3_um_filter_59_10]|nr:MAG: hypothetical protein COZ05_04690 [Armatimonadetes bacterium CG_4_10_14_3_um_filter_59_10]
MLLVCRENSICRSFLPTFQVCVLAQLLAHFTAATRRANNCRLRVPHKNNRIAVQIICLGQMGYLSTDNVAASCCVFRTDVLGPV